jgi:hypothetical protein
LNIINGVRRSSTTPSVTATFASAFPGTPRLCYGISRYEGKKYLWYKGGDSLNDEKFEVLRTGLGATSFSVSVTI